MSSTVWGKPYASGELSDTTYYQTIRPKSDMILKAVRTWIIFYDNPTVTSFNMKIYSNTVDGPEENNPSKLLHTSTNTLSKADIITENNGYREVYFEFANVNLQSLTYYNFVLNATGYSPSGDSHVAWRQGFPDPVYATGLTIATTKLESFPFAIYFASGALF